MDVRETAAGNIQQSAAIALTETKIFISVPSPIWGDGDHPSLPTSSDGFGELFDLQDDRFHDLSQPAQDCDG